MQLEHDTCRLDSVSSQQSESDRSTVLGCMHKQLLRDYRCVGTSENGRPEPCVLTFGAVSLQGTSIWRRMKPDLRASPSNVLTHAMRVWPLTCDVPAARARFVHRKKPSVLLSREQEWLGCLKDGGYGDTREQSRSVGTRAAPICMDHSPFVFSFSQIHDH
jgi:hypothetical protein